MLLIILYSALLVMGIAISQVFDLSSIREELITITMIFLGYIMIEVGLDFRLRKNKLSIYAWDYVIASLTAGLPWIFCAVYFVYLLKMDWIPALLISRFAAPTSAGILFTMLIAAGLSKTWVFKKSRVLAIFDDLDTVLFMIPLQMMFIGVKLELIFVFVFCIFLLFVAYKWTHTLRIPETPPWIFGYSVILILVLKLVGLLIPVHIEILLPAFVLGCIIYHSPHIHHETIDIHHIRHLSRSDYYIIFDQVIKACFMLLVGCSLPKFGVFESSFFSIAMHTLCLTFIINLGKCFPCFCYRKKASMKERVALSLSLFPRGEVGAGVLLIAIGYGIRGLPMQLAIAVLAVNLVLAGLFISIVKKLLKKEVSC